MSILFRVLNIIIMTKEEYNEKAKEIKKRMEDEFIQLNIQYSQEYHNFKVGDIIEDHIGKGKIKEINYGKVPYKINYPIVRFLVDNLTKKGTINKREPTRVMYGIDTYRK